jgi:hypothetical protein
MHKWIVRRAVWMFALAVAVSAALTINAGRVAGSHAWFSLDPGALGLYVILVPLYSLIAFPPKRPGKASQPDDVVVSCQYPSTVVVSSTP